MKHKVYIVDSNILLCLVESNKHGIVGNGDEWNKEKIEQKLNLLDKDFESVAIPLPMMIETSNIIGHDRDMSAGIKLIELLNKSFNVNKPYREFNVQKLFWEDDKIKEALNNWKDYIYNELGLGDFLVLLLKEFYIQRMKFEVEILTGDKALKSFAGTTVFKFEEPKGNRRAIRES